MIRRTRALALCLLAASSFALGQAAAAGPSLYKRLGGYDAVAAVTDDLVTRLATDKQLARFFVGMSDNSKARLRQHFVDQICAATGGPCVYTGRDMKTVHKGLAITESDWAIAVKHLSDGLDKFQVPAKEKSELLAIVAGVKPDVVEKP